MRYVAGINGEPRSRASDRVTTRSPGHRPTVPDDSNPGNQRSRPPHHGGGDRDADGYVDLRSYAAIGDGRTVALIARDGRIDWFPVPDLDSPSAFAAILDAEHGGHIALAPTAEFTVERRYVPDTNVLATTFHTATGSVRVTDSLNTGIAGRLPWVELGRRIDGLTGTVDLAAAVSPGTCLNTASPWTKETVHGAVLRMDGVSLAVRTLNEQSVELGGQHIAVRFCTRPGSRHLLGLVATEREPLYLPTPADVDRSVDRTVQNWQGWSAEFDCAGPYRDHIRRSALALKLLLHAPHGSIAAAATTSLPERVGGDKNWDYRYAWTRDMAYTLHALFRFGLREETHAAVSWLLRTIRRHGPEPRVAYRLNGDLVDGTERPDVPGWRGSVPVQIGNDAVDQLQLGVFGDLFTIVRTYVDNGNVLDDETGRLLAGIADQAADAWHRQDSGMWELPELRHYTTSKLGCWQALECAVELAEQGQIPGDPARWRDEAGRIRQWVQDNCWDADRGSYTWYPGSSELDASILLHAISGFDRGERMRSTIEVLQRELGANGLMYRYTGMDREEGCFVACSFWLVSALALTGQRDDAVILMDDLIRRGNDVGVYAEMIDPDNGEFLGNLPQALSHLALITAALTLSECDAEPGD